MRCNDLLAPNVIHFFFFFNDTATTEIYTLSLHDALPISFEDLQLLARLQRHDRLLPIRLLARHPPDPPDLSADVHHADFLDLDVQGALGRLPDLHLVGIGPHQKADLALTFPHVG